MTLMETESMEFFVDLVDGSEDKGNGLLRQSPSATNSSSPIGSIAGKIIAQPRRLPRGKQDRKVPFNDVNEEGRSSVGEFNSEKFFSQKHSLSQKSSSGKKMKLEGKSSMEISTSFSLSVFSNEGTPRKVSQESGNRFTQDVNSINTNDKENLNGSDMQTLMTDYYAIKRDNQRLKEENEKLKSRLKTAKKKLDILELQRQETEIRFTDEVRDSEQEEMDSQTKYVFRDAIIKRMETVAHEDALRPIIFNVPLESPPRTDRAGALLEQLNIYSQDRCELCGNLKMKI